MVIPACSQAGESSAVCMVLRPNDSMKINSPKVGLVFCQCKGMTPGLSVVNTSASQPTKYILFKASTYILARQQCPSGFVRDTHSIQGTISLFGRVPLSKCRFVFIILAAGKKSLFGLRSWQNCQAIHYEVVFFVHHLRCPWLC